MSIKTLRAVLATGFLSLALDVSSGWAQNIPHQLSAEDRNVIERSVADETLLPERARISGITASSTPQGVIAACGYVSWIDATGLYGPHRAFHGIVATNTNGARVFAIVGIARDDQDQEAIEIVCAQDGAPIRTQTSAPTAALPAHISELLSREGEMNRRCRGTEGATSPTVCDQRNELGRQLNAQGWCYGRDGEFGYQNEWHVCGPTSVRGVN